MPIKVHRVDDGYMATVTPSKYKDVSWSSVEPTASEVLVEQLVELGYHLQDIVDAFTDADPDWMARVSPTSRSDVQAGNAFELRRSNGASCSRAIRGMVARWGCPGTKERPTDRALELRL